VFAFDGGDGTGVATAPIAPFCAQGGVWAAGASEGLVVAVPEVVDVDVEVSV